MHSLVFCEIDSEFRFRLAQAEADYQNALSGKTVVTSTIHTTQNNIAVSDASVQEAKIRLDNAGREYNRYKNLLAQDAVTRQQYDAVQTEYAASKARYELLLRQKQSTALVNQEQTRRLEQTDAGIKVAEAALNLARLNLSYTVILAPCDGTTGRKEIQEGQLVQPGQTLVDLVDEKDKWVVANYKETQTAHISEGYKVDIEVDAIPGVVFKGLVKSVSQATGASFSLIPQDNSAGNFVKVEQRIPVRIEFSKDNRLEDMKRLRAGMNVECIVNYYILLHQSCRTDHLANSCQINSTGKLEDDNKNNNNPRFQFFRNEVTDSRICIFGGDGIDIRHHVPAEISFSF